MALPKKKKFIQEVKEQTWEDKGYVQPEPMVSPEFLQEINEPEHEEVKDESEESFIERVRRNIRFP